MTNNLSKNIFEILNDKYVIPFYQRNYAWEEPEISQLLEDIYESYLRSELSDYFIGSLVVRKRDDGMFEVIDGQQRITTISLIAKILNLENLQSTPLKYDSRQEVESFYESFYETGSIEKFRKDYKVAHFINAIDYINGTNLNPKEDQSALTLSKLQNKYPDKFKKFKKYFKENVKIVRIEIPKDTDVASYFEIMNNRGEQLHKHEILKAMLLGSNALKEEYRKQEILSEIWMACSQMNISIQKIFDSNTRKKYFGENYDEFLYALNRLEVENESFDNKTKVSKEKKNSSSIISILNHFNCEKGSTSSNDYEDVDDDYDTKTIIDFPNFLMHVFRLEFNQKYINLLNNKEQDIPLNEKYLLEVYEIIKEEMNPEKFIKKLFFYRVIFDKFIIKTHDDIHNSDEYRWILTKPKMYMSMKKQKTLKFINTFENEVQEQTIKALSMLQVTFRARIYKNWLNIVLGWFSEPNTIIDQKVFLEKVHQLMLDYYHESGYDKKIKRVIDNKSLSKSNSYSRGTNTPHFLFNFIDYLYWLNNKKSFNFDFKYRNSVEHHLPQSHNEDSKYENIIDNLGNLCLVSKSANSKMNNESPIGKADKITGKFYKDTLPPKQKIMYDLTNDKRWNENTIKEHYNNVVVLLENREKILANSLKGI